MSCDWQETGQTLDDPEARKALTTYVDSKDQIEALAVSEKALAVSWDLVRRANAFYKARGFEAIFGRSVAKHLPHSLHLSVLG